MSNIVVRSLFWNDQVTANLRLVVPPHFGFRKSDNIIPDLIFPALGSICFCVVRSTNLTPLEAERVEGVAAASKVLVVVVQLEEEFRSAYSEFVCGVSRNVNGVVFFPTKNFGEVAAKFIWQTACEYQEMNRKVLRILDEKKKKNPCQRVLNEVIQDKERLNSLVNLIQDGASLKDVIRDEIPEFIGQDFYLE
jgi:hypothetical protein